MPVEVIVLNDAPCSVVGAVLKGHIPHRRAQQALAAVAEGTGRERMDMAVLRREPLRDGLGLRTAAP